MKTLKQRINFDVPVSLVGTIQTFADMDGVTTAYWLRKALEKVVQEKLEESNTLYQEIARQRRQLAIDLNKLEAFNEK